MLVSCSQTVATILSLLTLYSMNDSLSPVHTVSDDALAACQRCLSSLGHTLSDDGPAKTGWICDVIFKQGT